MILAIDIGNTNIVIGCFDDNKVLFVERLSTNSHKTELEYAIDFKNVLELYDIANDDITGGIISSVVPSVTNIVKAAAEKIVKTDIIVVGSGGYGVKTGLNITIDYPKSLGSDLVVNAVAGKMEYPLPLIIFDLGTATTVSVVAENGDYIGGMIIPGVKTSLDSLTARTAQLPKIAIEAPENIIGQGTSECMKSGMIYSTAGSLDGIIDRIEEELGCRATAVATGGLASSIVPFCKREIILDDGLLLKGLMYIYKMQ